MRKLNTKFLTLQKSITKTVQNKVNNVYVSGLYDDAVQTFKLPGLGNTDGDYSDFECDED